MQTAEPAPVQQDKRSRRETLPRIEIKVSWCKGCGLCVEYCNRGVLEMNGVLPKVLNAEKCSRCLQCEAICPDFAIEVVDKIVEGEAAE